MKKTKAIEILVTERVNSATTRIRIISKPSRYSATRYWVVLPGHAGKEKWLLMPTPDEAFDQVCRWLRDHVIRTLEPTAEVLQGKNNAAKVPRIRTGSKRAQTQAPPNSSPIFYE